MDRGGLELSLRGRVLAASIGCLVRVSCLELHAVGLSVLHGFVLEASVATVRGGRAVNELLLGDRDEVSGLDLVVSLESGDGREGPAGSAVTLVLDLVDSSLGSPVDTGGKTSLLENSWLCSVVLVDSVSKESLELIIGPGRELVVANSEGVGLILVDLSKGGILGGEQAHSVLVLLLGAIAQAEVSHVNNEALLEVGGHGGGVVAHVKSDESGGGAETHIK